MNKRTLSKSSTSLTKKRLKQSYLSRKNSNKIYKIIYNNNETTRILLYNEIKSSLNNDLEKCFIFEKINDSNDSFKLNINLENENILSFIYKNDNNIISNNKIFFTLLEINNKPYNIANKIIINQEDQEENNEVKILRILNDDTIKNITIHFPFVYCVINCDMVGMIMHDKNNGVDFTEKTLKLLNQLDSKYIMILNEKADGDLTKYIKNHFDNNLYEKNVLIIQLLLCIYTLHSKKIVHHDISGGNFLYHVDKNLNQSHNIYIQYNLHYNGKISLIYLKIYNQCIWTLWDFEISKCVTEIDVSDVYNVDFVSFKLMLMCFNIKVDDIDDIIINKDKFMNYIIEKYNNISDEQYILYNSIPYNISI